MILMNIKRYFFMGLACILPLLVVFYLLRLLFIIIDNVVHYIPLPQYLQDVPMINVVVCCVLIFSIGYFVTTLLGKLFMKWIDYFIDQVPVIRSLFNLMKQAMLSVLSDKCEHFQNVVLVQYPSDNIWSLGFVSRFVKYEVENYVDRDNTVAVFIPTSPNPSSGFLVFVSIKKVHILQLTATEAINIIISAGIYCPSNKFTNTHLLLNHVKNTYTSAKQNTDRAMDNTQSSFSKESDNKANQTDTKIFNTTDSCGTISMNVVDQAIKKRSSIAHKKNNRSLVTNERNQIFTKKTPKKTKRIAKKSTSK